MDRSHTVLQRKLRFIGTLFRRLLIMGIIIAPSAAQGSDISEGLISRGAHVVEGKTAVDYVRSSYGRSWAVVIGIDEYQAAPRLSYAVADAKALAAVLELQGFRVVTLYNKEATRRAIYSELFRRLAESLDEHDRVLIFFAGHGETRQIKSGKPMGFLLPVDGDPESLVETSISMSGIRDLAESLPAKHVLFLVDVCYGGVAGQRFRNINKMTDRYLREITREKGRQLITAGGADQRALEGPEWGHSVFTHYLLQGLEKGLADANGDGIIPASELYQYLDERVFAAASLKGHRQRPEFWTMAAEHGEFVFFPGTKTGGVVTNKMLDHNDGSLESQAASSKRKSIVESTFEQKSIGAESNGGSNQKPIFKEVEKYFPRSVGSVWQYQGQIITTEKGATTRKAYTNVASVARTELYKGHTLNVTVEANSGNRGQVATYSEQDRDGIIIYGWQPTDKVFSKIGPFQFIRFSLSVPSSLQQFNATGLAFGKDLDRDGMEEKADVISIMTVVGTESLTVPAGHYPEALRFDFDMRITVYLSRSGERLIISTTGTRWYGKNVGLLKEVKAIAMPAMRGFTEEYTTNLTEELASSRIVP
jgi:hypothetical protein